MNKLKKLVKVLAFVCLILLAGIGIGISGGVPFTILKKRRDQE